MTNQFLENGEHKFTVVFDDFGQMRIAVHANELLEALMGLLAMNKEHHYPGGYKSPQEVAAFAVIAKATGA